MNLYSLKFSPECSFCSDFLCCIICFHLKTLSIVLADCYCCLLLFRFYVLSHQYLLSVILYFKSVAVNLLYLDLLGEGKSQMSWHNRRPRHVPDINDFQFFSCPYGSVASSSFGTTALFLFVLHAPACLLKDDSSQACLVHAVHMINRERWS